MWTLDRPTSTGRDLPDVTARVLETSRPRTPGSVHRAVDQLYAACEEPLAERVDVGDADGELEARTVRRPADLCRCDQVIRLGGLEEVDERPTELEHRRVGVLEVDRKLEHLLVEALRGVQILLEQSDSCDPGHPRRHEAHPSHRL